jgi:hypothetical protein
MNRFSSQLVFCTPDKILRRTAIEQDENLIIHNLISLDEQSVEPSNTLFFDGIISTEIISLKQNQPLSEKKYISADYQLFELQMEDFDSRKIQSEKKIVLDFGTSDITEINQILLKNSVELSKLDVFEIIAGSVYYPSLILGKPKNLDKNIQSQLFLWQQIDMVNKRTTSMTNLKLLTLKL